MTLLDYGILANHDASKRWTPVVVNKDGHESGFKVFDRKCIPKERIASIIRWNSLYL